MSPEDIQFPAFQGHTVKLSVINGCRCRMAAGLFVDTPSPNQTHMLFSGYSFLVESEHRGRKALFDLAFMKDLGSRMPPAMGAAFPANESVMKVEEIRDVPDTIVGGGLSLSEIDHVILSHAHIDHMGDPSVFPSTTELVVGPGFKAQHVPGYPINPDSLVLNSAFESRAVREVDFSSSSINVGGFRAIDFFDDGSFFILAAPGHTGDHICALGRTTEDTWVFMGADVCHSVAQIRPNGFRPIPQSGSSVPSGVTSVPAADGHGHCARSKQICNRAIYGLAEGMHESVEESRRAVEKVQAFDGQDNVLLVLSHDATLLSVLDFFPSSINDWKAKDWADQGRWLFLEDLVKI